MPLNKTLEFKRFLEEVKKCNRCMPIYVKRGGKIKDCGLVNFLADDDIGYTVPTIWTDWLNRLEAEIFIVGQDWGPIEAIKKFSDKFKKYSDSFSSSSVWRNLVREPDGMTTRYLTEHLRKSARFHSIELPKYFLDDIFVTNAVLCARQGHKFRGNENYAPRDSTSNCAPYLKHQIEIIHPKIVITLGGWPLWALSQLYGFDIDRSLTRQLEKLRKEKGYIQIHSEGFSFHIVPVYHPAAVVSKSTQVESYKTVWKILKEEYWNDEELLIRECFKETAHLGKKNSFVSSEQLRIL
jgi:uracil-DNA glycosylase family 4